MGPERDETGERRGTPAGGTGDAAGTPAAPPTQAVPPPGSHAGSPAAPPHPGPPVSAPAQPPPSQATLAAARQQERWRRELGRLRGLNVGAAVYGWLVAVGIAALLTALVAAAGAAVGLQQGTVADVSDRGTALTLGGAILLLVVLVIAYYAGGYVAGRLSRFDGAIQGVAVWVLGVLVTGALAIAGAVAGSQYNVLGQLRLPSIPVQGQTLVSGAVITLCAIAVLTLITAVLGGIVGHRYHDRVDRAVRGVSAGPG